MAEEIKPTVNGPKLIIAAMNKAEELQADRDRWRELAGRLADMCHTLFDDDALMLNYSDEQVERWDAVLADYDRAANDTVSTERG